MNASERLATLRAQYRGDPDLEDEPHGRFLLELLDQALSQRDAWAEKAAEAGQYEALNRALGDRLGVYMTRLAEAREVLNDVQWSDSSACPLCYQYKDLGHSRGCKLAKCLEGVND